MLTRHDGFTCERKSEEKNERIFQIEKFAIRRESNETIFNFEMSEKQT